MGGERRKSLEFRPGPVQRASRAGLYLLANGKIMASEPRSRAELAVLLQEESSSCLCMTILDRDNRPKSGQRRWEEIGGAERYRRSRILRTQHSRVQIVGSVVSALSPAKTQVQ